jgi:hypothetical protein
MIWGTALEHVIVHGLRQFFEAVLRSINSLELRQLLELQLGTLRFESQDANTSYAGLNAFTAEFFYCRPEAF